ncbi:MAG: DevR family CRISPR-associated autoregulator, partial [Methanosarcinales archaeon]
MEANNKIYEIAILGRVTWDLHSLSNEGTVGNVTEPRTLMLADGTKTDGISGEMLKHIHAENVWILEPDKNKFCKVCKILRPERADGNEDVRKKKKVEDAVEKALECELCDIHGFLVQTPTVARESTVEFGWAVGIPEVKRDIHVHARHAVHEAYIAIEEEQDKGKCDKRECDKEEVKVYKIKGKWYCEEHIPRPTPQMIYHRPTRSGKYAIISVFQPWRIGLNNVNFEYDVSDDIRKKRYE